MTKKDYLVKLKDLKFLVDNLENRRVDRKDAVNWIRTNKKTITPEFMNEVYGSKDLLSKIYQTIICSINVRKLKEEGVEIVSIY